MNYEDIFRQAMRGNTDALETMNELAAAGNEEVQYCKRGRNLSCCIYLLFMLLIGSCTEETSTLSLTNQNISFRELLASISKDEGIPNTYYIGTEDGIVFVFNSENYHVDTLYTPFDRIYKVVRDNTDGRESLYWIGTRNQGLCCCERKSDSLVLSRQYSIPSEGKGTKFSAYDIAVLSCGIYVATSHGLFVVNNFSEVLDPLCVTHQTAASGKLSPVVYSQLGLSDDRKSLYCASDSGLKRVDLISRNVTDCIPETVKGFVLHGDSILALTGGRGQCDNLKLYRISKNIITTTYPLKARSKEYYYDAVDSIHYFINDNYIELAENRSITELKKHKIVPLHSSARATTCRNIIVDDPEHQQMIMVTSHSLSLIAHHQNVFNSYGAVEYACTDGNYIYYLIGSKLYRQDTESQHPMTAHEIKKLSSNDVRFMVVKDGILFYVTSNDELFQAKLYGNYFINSMLPDKALMTFPKNLTGMGKDRNNVYVGIRDGLICLSANDTVQINLVPDPFITALTPTPDSDSILMSSLNDGIYIGKDISFRLLSGTEKFQFIRDLSVCNDSLYFLTNRHLYRVSTTGEITPLREAQGYSRVFAVDSTHIYAVGQQGVTNLMDGSQILSDVRFTSEGCVRKDKSLYLGSGSGVFVIDGDAKHSYRSVVFKNTLVPTLLGVIIAGMLLIILIITSWLRDRYMMRRESLLSFKNRLLEDVHELEKADGLISKLLLQELSTAEEMINAVELSPRKQAKNALRTLRKTLQGLTSRVTSTLVLKLQEQRSVVAEHRQETLLIDIDRAIHAHTPKELIEQIQTTALRIDEMERLRQKLESYSEFAKQLKVCMGRQGMDRLLHIEKFIESINDSESSVPDKLEHIRTQLADIDREETMKVVTGYASIREEEIRTLMEEQEEESWHREALDTIVRGYGELMSTPSANLIDTVRGIANLDRQQVVISELISLKTLVQDYQTIDRKVNGDSSPVGGVQFNGEYTEAIERHKRAEEQKKSMQEKRREEEVRIVETINRVYDAIFISDKKLLDILEYRRKKSANDQFMTWTVLALLMTDTGNIPVRRYKFLGNEQRLRAARRDILTLIRRKREELLKHAEGTAVGFSLVIYLIAIADEDADESKLP